MSGELIVERLAKLDTCAVSDGMDRLGLKGATYGVRPMWNCPKIVGRAVTMKIKPVGLEKPKQHLGTAAIVAANPGDIIVIDNGGRPDTSCWGGLLSLAAKTKGISGVVIDGAARDIDESRDVGFPVYARAAIPMTARNRVMQESFNQEIQFASAQVHPGDLVIADGSGIVFIPRAKEEEVLKEAEAVAATEARMAEGIRQGLSVLEVLEKLGYESMLQKEATEKDS
jgi:regulator of RNase E activity RraA